MGVDVAFAEGGEGGGCLGGQREGGGEFCPVDFGDCGAGGHWIVSWGDGLSSIGLGSKLVCPNVVMPEVRTARTTSSDEQIGISPNSDYITGAANQMMRFCQRERCLQGTARNESEIK